MDNTGGGKKGLSKHVNVEDKAGDKVKKSHAPFFLRPICVGAILGSILPVVMYVIFWISGVHGTPSENLFACVLKPINALWEGAKEFLIDLGLMHRESIVGAIVIYICILSISGACAGGLAGFLVAVIKKVRAGR